MNEQQTQILIDFHKLYVKYYNLYESLIHKEVKVTINKEEYFNVRELQEAYGSGMITRNQFEKGKKKFEDGNHYPLLKIYQNLKDWYLYAEKSLKEQWEEEENGNNASNS